MKKTENFSIKLVIVLVITVFALVAIIYLAQKDWSEKGFVCGNGIVEGREECDGNSIAHGWVGACDLSKYEQKCNHSCKMECQSKNIVPVACTREYMPVCGMKDGVLQTFGNDCVAEADGVFDYTEGECPVVCGNGIIESGEQCDGSALKPISELSIDEMPLCGCMPDTKIVHTCQSDCTQTCHCEAAAEPVCGNGIIEAGEQCDGSALKPISELSIDEMPLCGCMPGSKTVYACLNNCQQTCHCEE